MGSAVSLSQKLSVLSIKRCALIFATMPFAGNFATAQSVTNRYTYDAQGRVVAVVVQSGAADGSNANYQYDKAGNRSRVVTVASSSNSAWSYCSAENGVSDVSGANGEQWQVRYGAEPNWSYKTLSLASSSQSIPCNNDTFGDPISGTVKNCGRRLVATAWEVCASENENCILAGSGGQKWEIQYGADPNWSSSRYITLTTSNAAISCDNTTFGDPYSGVVKICRKRILR
jgi:hypothetical protein